MTPVEFALALDAHQYRCIQRRQYQELAEELALEGHIEPWARQLVPLLGKRGDRTNLEALTTWVAHEVATLDFIGADVLDRLYARLAVVLDN